VLISNVDSLTTSRDARSIKIVRRQIRLLLIIVHAPTFSTHLVLLPSSPSGCQAGDLTTGARRLPSWRGIKPVPSRPGKGVRGESTVRPRGGTGFQQTCCQFTTVKRVATQQSEAMPVQRAQIFAHVGPVRIMRRPWSCPALIRMLINGFGREQQKLQAGQARKTHFETFVM
jgi:hypothetical protein